MVAAVLRLLALVALVVMPLGMAGAPALAQAMPAEHAMAPMDHCDERQDPAKAPMSKMDCTAMCTALPATNVSAPVPVVKPGTPRSVAIAAPFSGAEPELATPPPKPA